MLQTRRSVELQLSCNKNLLFFGISNCTLQTYHVRVTAELRKHLFQSESSLTIIHKGSATRKFIKKFIERLDWAYYWLIIKNQD
jgi:hypothetical protein